MIYKITVKGAVQGVGYRPFIAFKAEELNISGFVNNIGAAVLILAIGTEEKLTALVSFIKSSAAGGLSKSLQMYLNILSISNCAEG